MRVCVFLVLSVSPRVVCILTDAINDTATSGEQVRRLLMLK